MIEFIKLVANLLNKKGIEYLIVGSAAQLLFKEKRNPSDLDVLIRNDRKNLEKFKAIIKNDIQISEFQKGKIIRVIGKPFSIDFHSKLDGLNLDRIRIAAENVCIDGINIKVIHKEDLKTNLATVQDIINGTITI